MNSLCGAQARAYYALREFAEHPFFLHVLDSTDALWVSDYPRKEKNAEKAGEALTALNMSYKLDEYSQLWRIDWTPEGYLGALFELPASPPSFPKNEILHPAYALCRLLFTHHVPLKEQPLEMLRTVLKLANKPQNALLHAVPALHEACAQKLREKKNLPSAMGQVLAQWLMEKEL